MFSTLRVSQSDRSPLNLSRCEHVADGPHIPHILHIPSGDGTLDVGATEHGFHTGGVRYIPARNLAIEFGKSVKQATELRDDRHVDVVQVAPISVRWYLESNQLFELLSGGCADRGGKSHPILSCQYGGLLWPLMIK